MGKSESSVRWGHLDLVKIGLRFLPHVLWKLHALQDFWEFPKTKGRMASSSFKLGTLSLTWVSNTNFKKLH